jgi:site-specific recombinase XerC
VFAREEGRVQLSITGKGGKVRQVLLPAIVSRALLSLRGDVGANDPVFASRKGGGHLIERGVHFMVKRAAAKAGINEDVSPALAKARTRHPRHRRRRQCPGGQGYARARQHRDHERLPACAA